MNRRTFLATAGVGLVGAVAGCSEDAGSESPTAEGTGSMPVAGGTATEGTASAGETASAGQAPYKHAGTLEATFVANGDYPADPDPADGLPPSFSDPPASPDADPGSFETLSVNDETVRLAPIDVVNSWYRRGEARFVDARAQEQYTRSHLYSAVLSPAQPDSQGGGIEGWPYADRVVTYCGCPHHLSSIRAAGLQKVGFEEVYALDEGFFAWRDREYPMAGTDFAGGQQQNLSEWEIAGRVDADYAGEYVWVSAGQQYEAAPVGADGSYRLHLRFSDVSSETTVRLETPEGSVRRRLGAVGSRV